MRLSVSPATPFSDGSLPNHTKMFELVHVVTSMEDFGFCCYETLSNAEDSSKCGSRGRIENMNIEQNNLSQIFSTPYCYHGFKVIKDTFCRIQQEKLLNISKAMNIGLIRNGHHERDNSK
jgi:hypothetical protein